MPKVGLIISSIVSAALGLSFSELYGLVVTSSETKKVEQEAESIRWHQAVTNELGAAIGNLTLVLDLNKPIHAKDFVHNGFLVRLRNFGPSKGGLPYDSLQALFGVGRNGPEERWLFWGESFALVGRQRTVSTGFGRGAWESELQSLPLPITLENASSKPFKFIRDLDDCEIDLFVPSKIADYAVRIRLLVNSGYEFRSYVLIFSRLVVPDDWIKTNYDLGNNFEQKGIILNNKISYIKLKKTPERNPWKVDIMQASIEREEDTLPDILRIPY